MKYTAILHSNSWRDPKKRQFSTITEARAWAESYGTTADHCDIYNTSELMRTNRPIATHTRWRDGDGTRWHK
jgi:hypothetical protein